MQAPGKAPIVTPASPTPPWIISTSNRCGSSELDARGNCGRTCTSNDQCIAASGGTVRQWCFVVHENYCNSKPNPKYCNTATMIQAPQFRCGINELEARERCGKKCTKGTDCTTGQHCWSVYANTCDC
jgi:hypothetical protein